MDNLIIIPTEETPKEKVSLKSKPSPKPVSYEADKLELSENIKKFDKKVKVYTSNPYSYNAVSLKKTKLMMGNNQTATQMITNQTYNSIGKFLGVDTLHDWGRYYDKVFTVTEWAKEKVGDDSRKIANWLTQKLNHIPTMGAKRIDDLYIAAKLDLGRRKSG